MKRAASSKCSRVNGPCSREPVAVLVEGVVEMGIVRLIAMLARYNGVRMQAFHDPARAQQWLREAAGFREIS